VATGSEPEAGEHGPVSVPRGFRVGCWEVRELLGSGGWGSVYAARSIDGAPRAGPADVALKFLPAELATPGRIAHLADVVERELQFAGGGHAGLIRTFEILRVSAPGAEIDGARVLVMERARTSLRELIAQRGEATPLPGADRILRELWDALAGMHARGWIHGDVKLANVLIMDDGGVRLADFGLAAELDGTHAYAPRFGSLDYVPPEWWSQRVTEDGARVRPAHDLWAYGVVAHLVLAGGRFPFAGQTARARTLLIQAYAGGNEPLRLDPAVPERWRPLIADLLAPTEAQRTAAAERVGRSIGTMPRGPDDAGRAPRRRPPALPRRSWVAVAGAVVATAAVLLVFVLMSGGPGGDAAPARDLPVGGELRPDADVPARYRASIVAAAHGCSNPALTPALVAAILKVESGFNPDAANEATGEYGIAMWTPWLFDRWSKDTDGGGASYRSAADSIYAVGQYLCVIGRKLTEVRGDPALLLAATYRVGSERVVATGGIPPRQRKYVADVEHYARRYAATPAD